jgi:phospholipid/cholesterol/gamma-HCH transport system substrate-binding protein
MQITSSQKRRVALFFIFGAGVFILLAIVLAGNRLLKREDCYYTRLQDISIAGLTEGSTVKFQGMNIGHVREISIDRDDTSIVQLNFCLKPGVPIKEGTMTQLGNIGITGLKFLELKGGGDGPNIVVGGEIPSQRSEWDEITGKASVIAAKLESILNNLNNAVEGIKKEDVEEIMTNVSGISKSVDQILKENKGNITSIVARVDTLLKEVNSNMNNVTEITKNVRVFTSTEGSLQKTVATIEGMLSDIRRDYNEADVKDKINTMFELVESVQKTVDTINLTLERSKEHIDNSFSEMSEGMSNFNEFTRTIMETPSALFGSPSTDEVK